jgi:multiple sugar transport system ATP-binding protein
MARIELQDVSKVYTGGVRAVNALSLDIPDGDFMVFVGPSGCGKSTALRMVAGLEDITEGEIRIGDRVVNDMPPKDRDIAMVFQNYALYPHMTVEDNLAFGLQLRKTPKDEQKKRVAEAAKMLALEPFLKRKPAALSGGQRQRVAMGRAIVRTDRRPAPQLPGGCQLRPGRLAADQGRGGGDRGAGVGGECDLQHGRPPGPSRHHDRQVRQGGQG